MGHHTVIHVITRLDYGGSAQNTMLTTLGHHRDVFTPLIVAGLPGRWDAQGGQPATEMNCRLLDRAGIRWHLVSTLVRPVRPLEDLRALWELIRLFRREKPALVHTHTSKAGVLGRIAAWMAGVPAIVHTPHGHVFYGHFGRILTWVFLQIEQVLSRLTHRLITLTESERDDHLRHGVGRPEQIAVIPSGIELESFRKLVAVRKERPSSFTCPSDAVVIGSVGWLTDIKGHRFLIEAFARVKADHPSLHLVIVGTGPLKDDLSALATRLGIHNSVQLLGHQKDIEICLKGIDVFVFPSLNEGMGRALIEAMAAGLPVVATQVGGIPALIDSGSNGILVPPADVEALAAAMRTLIDQPQFAKQLGEHAHRSITERFTVGHMVRSIETLYRDTLTERHAW